MVSHAIAWPPHCPSSIARPAGEVKQEVLFPRLFRQHFQRRQLVAVLVCVFAAEIDRDPVAHESRSHVVTGRPVVRMLWNIWEKMPKS